MMWPFKCKHPFRSLSVEREQTETIRDADFIDVTYHLHCNNCGENLELKHCKLIGGVEGFMKRGRSKL